MNTTGWKLLHKEQYWISGAHVTRASNRSSLSLLKVYEYDGYIIYRRSSVITKEGKKFWRTDQWDVCGFKYPTNYSGTDNYDYWKYCKSFFGTEFNWSEVEEEERRVEEEAVKRGVQPPPDPMPRYMYINRNGLDRVKKFSVAKPSGLSEDIVEIINEEVKSLFENLEVYTIPQLAQMLSNVKQQYQNAVPYLEKMLFDEYKKNGDAGVEKMYAKMSGVEIEALRNGRYVFGRTGGGGQPQLEEVQNLQGKNVESISNKQDVLRQYIDVLKADSSNPNNDLAITYFIILINFLDIERMFSGEIKQAGKQLNANLNVEPLDDVEAVYKKFLELYDNHSKVRFAVETFDSIEPIRLYLKDHPEVYRELNEGDVKEKVVEVRQGMMNYIKQQLPQTPDYILRDLVYPASKDGRTDLIDHIKNYDWKLVKDMRVTMDMFDADTQRKLNDRKGGSQNPLGVPRDAERHDTQKQLIMQRGLPTEPIIMTINGNKYELWEGWHRTIQLLQMFPQGFKYPQVYVGSRKNSLNEEAGVKTPQEIADSLEKDPYYDRWKANYPETYEEPIHANVDMKLADEAFKRDSNFYIGPDDKGIGNRKERVMQTIEDGSLRYAPKVSLSMSHYDVPVMSFDDGRHRFAVLRDLGVKSINLTFHHDSAPYIHLLQRGGVSEDLFESIEKELKDVLQRGDIDEVEDNANHTPDEMPYIMEDLSGAGLDERQDMEKIDEVNALKKEVDDKLKRKDFSEIKRADKGVLLIAAINIPRDQHVLEINFTNIIKRGTAGDYGVDDNGSAFINIFDCDVIDDGGNNVEIYYNENTLSHELRHYLDWQRGDNVFAQKYNTADGDKTEYYNNPSEYNAIMIQYLRQYVNQFGVKYVDDEFQKFYNSLIKNTKIGEYKDNLNADMQKKFMNRLYAFHQRLIEKRDKLIIAEEMPFIMEGRDNMYSLYHGSNIDNLSIDNIKSKIMWLASSPEYARIWGEHIYEIQIRLNNVLDAYQDLGNKKLTVKPIIKYLKSKGVDTQDFEWAMRDYMDDNEKFSFWECVGDSPAIAYTWLSTDIFTSGYDAIKLFEYAYTKREKNATYKVNEPRNKIINIEKL